jgi:nucleoside 2-deoxyribosyltransferase
MPIKVYIAGPYTKGDPVINTHNAIKAGEMLASFGFVPFIPHLTHFWHFLYPHDADYWYRYDFNWLDTCDCLLRLPGESKGADEEMRRMIDQGKPCFLDIPSLREHYGGN